MKRGLAFAAIAALNITGLVACGKDDTTPPPPPPPPASVLDFSIAVGARQPNWFMAGFGNIAAFFDTDGTTPCGAALLYSYRLDHADGTMDEIWKVYVADSGNGGHVCDWMIAMTEKEVCHGYGVNVWSEIPGMDAKNRMSVSSTYVNWTGDTNGDGVDDQCGRASFPADQRGYGDVYQSVIQLDGAGVSGDPMMAWTPIYDPFDPTTPQVDLINMVEPASIMPLGVGIGYGFPFVLCDHPGVVGVAGHETDHGNCPIPTDNIF